MEREQTPLELAASPASAAYAAVAKGAGTRGWMVMVGALHRAGYGRLRLACRWENAGPAPVWFGDVLPVTYFSTEHGAVLVWNPESAGRSTGPANAAYPNAVPMFSSRRCVTRDYPWPDFAAQTPDEAAAEWVRRYPVYADAGRGADPPYELWYAAMLTATAPTGLIAANRCFDAPGPRMIVDCGPPGVTDFERPPPGEMVPPEPAPEIQPPPVPRPWWVFW